MSDIFRTTQDAYDAQVKRTSEAVELLQELLDAIPPRNSYEHEREHFEQVQEKVRQWLEK